MLELYKKFYKENFSINRYKKYKEDFLKEVSKQYALATCPYFLSKQNSIKIKEKILPAIISLLNSKSYQENIYKRGWFLDKFEVKKEDFFGSADFHINGNEIKLIEINFFIPGHFGFIEMFPKLFSRNFDFQLENFAQGFEKKLANKLIKKYKKEKVAICVNHLSRSEHYFEHYKYVEKFLNKNGLKAKVVFAKDISYLNDNQILYKGEKFGGILNIVIPRNWEHNQAEFSSYTNTFKKAPHLFFPNPWCWTMGDKRFLAILSNCDEDDFNLSKNEIEILKTICLKSKILSSFKNTDEIYSLYNKEIVLKPIDDYHTNGVLIKPSLKQIEQIFKTNKNTYIAQKYFQASQIYYKDEQNEPISPYRAQLRVEFFNAKFLNYRAYGYSDPYGYSPMMPVVEV